MRSTTIMTLLAIHAALAFPLSAQGEMQEAPDIGEVDEFPMAEICLLPDGTQGNTCAAFFLDEDGYEICLRDEVSGETRCSSSHNTQGEQFDVPAAFHSGMLGI